MHDIYPCRGQWGRQYAQRTTKDAAPAVDSGVASLGDDWMMIGMGPHCDVLRNVWICVAHCGLRWLV